MLNNIHLILHTIHSMLHSIHSILHTIHSSLRFLSYKHLTAIFFNIKLTRMRLTQTLSQKIWTQISWRERCDSFPTPVQYFTKHSSGSSRLASMIQAWSASSTHIHVIPKIYLYVSVTVCSDYDAFLTKMLLASFRKYKYVHNIVSSSCDVWWLQQLEARSNDDIRNPRPRDTTWVRGLCHPPQFWLWQVLSANR